MASDSASQAAANAPSPSAADADGDDTKQRVGETGAASYTGTAANAATDRSGRDKPRRDGPSAAARLAALVATFAVSGLMHEVLLWVCTGDASQLGKQTWFFAIQVRVEVWPMGEAAGGKGCVESESPRAGHKQRGTRLRACVARCSACRGSLLLGGTCCGDEFSVSLLLQAPLMLAEQQLVRATTRAGVKLPVWLCIPVASLTLQASLGCWQSSPSESS